MQHCWLEQHLRPWHITASMLSLTRAGPDAAGAPNGRFANLASNVVAGVRSFMQTNAQKGTAATAAQAAAAKPKVRFEAALGNLLYDLSCPPGRAESVLLFEWCVSPCLCTFTFRCAQAVHVWYALDSCRSQKASCCSGCA